MAVGGLTVAAYPAVHTYSDTAFAYKQVITDDGGVDIDITNVFNNNAAWEVNTTVTEDDSVDDNLLISWYARHNTGPHGEPPNAVAWIGSFDINAEDYAEAKGHQVTAWGGPIRHGDHADKFQARVVFDVTESTFDWDQIIRYSYVNIGFHTENVYEWRPFDSTLLGSKTIPGNDSNAHGNLLFDYKPLAQTYGVTMGVVGISRDRIIGTRMYVGLPGQNGTPIADVAPGSMFQPQGQNSCALLLSNQPFPVQYAQYLSKGMIYLVIHTQSYPNGEIRGHLKPSRSLNTLNP
ncbi:MAG: hypothetical protein HONBIEJF_00432 [Fimbriimonadaceae bacterium]|nr:hypothetical protein [Fimbriimonadaceae bacterium]